MAGKKKILIVEDDIKIVELLRDYFKQAGFDISSLYNGSQVVRDVKFNPPDIIILDITLPDKDGLTICKELRDFSNVPIIIISARSEEIDRVLALELGADDYICKPFSPKEVVARVIAILRRTNRELEDAKLMVGPIMIDCNNYKAVVGGYDLQLTLTEFELLKTLASRPCDVFTRDDLASRLREYDPKYHNRKADHRLEDQGEKIKNGTGNHHRIIDNHIRNLRMKINKVLPASNLIQTIYGMGYSLNLSQDENTSDNFMQEVLAPD